MLLARKRFRWGPLGPSSISRLWSCRRTVSSPCTELACFTPRAAAPGLQVTTVVVNVRNVSSVARLKYGELRGGKLPCDSAHGPGRLAG
jgi:hypothetical protein